MHLLKIIILREKTLSVDNAELPYRRSAKIVRCITAENLRLA